MSGWKEECETELAEGEATECAVSPALNQAGGCLNITSQRRRLWRMLVEVSKGEIYFSIARSFSGKKIMQKQRAGEGWARERRNDSSRELRGVTDS